MEKILKKMMMKYFVFKLQEDWREELKKIPEEHLKQWMDEDLFVKMEEQAESLASGFIDEATTTWDNELWMDINDFVSDYNEELEKIQEDQDVPEEYWDTEDGDAEEDISDIPSNDCGHLTIEDMFSGVNNPDQEIPEEYWDTEDGDAEEENKEVALMQCLDANPACNCDHMDTHPHSIGCDTGCVYQQHSSCVVYAEDTGEEWTDIPDEIAKTGGL